MKISTSKCRTLLWALQRDQQNLTPEQFLISTNSSWIYRIYSLKGTLTWDFSKKSNTELTLAMHYPSNPSLDMNHWVFKSRKKNIWNECWTKITLIYLRLSGHQHQFVTQESKVILHCIFITTFIIWKLR